MSALKKIRGVIFIKEPEVEMITEEQQRNKQTVKELCHVTMCKRKHQMKMIHAIFRLKKQKEKEKWKVHL
jgi:hypothetical protein